ncbi:hypothetical protein BU198_13655 [Streptomyces sp. CBMA156]|nr:hypothetical protein [Streptomyces sp. CBMA156]
MKARYRQIQMALSSQDGQQIQLVALVVGATLIWSGHATVTEATMFVSPFMIHGRATMGAHGAASEPRRPTLPRRGHRSSRAGAHRSAQG